MATMLAAPIVLFALYLLISALIKTASGVTCYGFFGVAEASCLGSFSLTAPLIIYFWVFPPGMIYVMAIIVLYIVEAARYARSKLVSRKL